MSRHRHRADHRGLESRVDRGDDGRFTGEALGDRPRNREQLRVEVGAPAVVVVLHLERAPRQSRGGIERRDHLGERGVVGRARQAVQRERDRPRFRPRRATCSSRRARRSRGSSRAARSARARPRRAGWPCPPPSRHRRVGRPRRSPSTSRVGLGIRIPDDRGGGLHGARNAASCSRGATQTATASRGIAFRLLPPSSETSRKGAAAYASRSTRPSTLIAFARPRAMSMPEWPPSPPLRPPTASPRRRRARAPAVLDPDPRVGAAGAPDGQLRRPPRCRG